MLREQIRDLINAPSTADIALLKNTSEAISVVAAGINWQSGDNIVSTNEEFPSNRIPWEAQQGRGATLKRVAVQGDDPEAELIAACDEKTRLMTVSSVQYGSGLRLDLERLGKFCAENDILYCVDAIQSIGAYAFDVQAIKADFVMADAHKWMLGPEGLALFYCKASVREQLELHQYGWHMVEHAGDYDREDWEIAASARRFECGTANMLGTFALSASLSLLDEVGIETIESRILDNAHYLYSQLQELADIDFISRHDRKLQSGIVTFRLGKGEQKNLHAQLMRNRVVCAHRFGGIRLSPHFYTSRDRLDKVLTILADWNQ